MPKLKAASQLICEEDFLRAQYYQLLARLLAAPPDAALIRLTSGLAGDETELGRSLADLSRCAAYLDAAAIEQEYNDLFIGVGRGELVPYGSFYLTGFLNEKPLARLRDDMAALGIARAAAVGEPEDHIAALCEMMSGFITGEFGEPLALPEQRRFFRAHLLSWAPRFFADLEAADGARFYRPVGAIGRTFVGIEAQAFEMEA